MKLIVRKEPITAYRPIGLNDMGARGHVNGLWQDFNVSTVLFNVGVCKFTQILNCRYDWHVSFISLMWSLIL